ncbi:MAG: 2,3-butanediol dehydrogenase [Solibacillus sp.]
MKAAVFHNVKDIRIEELEKPTIQPNQVLIEVALAGICGSDIGIYNYGLGTEPHPITKHSGNTIMGHEFSGTIVEVGAVVSNFQAGDRVCVEPLIYCGTCPACTQGFYNQCHSVGFVGINRHGGFAQYVAIDDHMLHKLPDNVSFEEGALVEPTAVSFYGVRESNLKVGDSVIIYGAGPIGLLTLLCVKAAGASKIVVVDISEERCKKAQELGASLVVKGDAEDLVPQILAFTNGGADIVFDCAGVQSTVNNALYTTKMGAQIVLLATFKKPIEIDSNIVMFKALHLTSTLAYRNVFPTVIELIAEGRLKVSSVITSQIELADIVDKGFETLINDIKQAKILVKP